MERQISDKLELDTLKICRSLANFLYLDLCDTIDITVPPGTMADSIKQVGSTVPQRGTRIIRHMKAAAGQLSSDSTSTQQARSVSDFTYRSQQRHILDTGLSLFYDKFLVIGIFLSLSFCAFFFVMMIWKKRWPL